MDDSLEIENYIREQEKANPTFDYWTDSSLVKRFESLGLAKGAELFLSKFRFDTSSNLQLINSNGEKISLWFEFAPWRFNKNKLNASFANDTIQINLPGSSAGLQYTWLDVLPGGNKELVYLDEYYIMNGDNFDFIVYAIKTF